MTAIAAPAPYPDDDKLTAEQLAQALALYRRLVELRRSGVRLAVVSLAKPGEPWRVAAVGRRVDIG